MKKTLFVLYKNLTSAYDAAEALQRNGFEPGKVSFFASDNGPKGVVISDVDVADGGNFGALIGGITGLLLVWGFLAIPGLGSIASAGPLATVIGGVMGAGVGAGTGVLIGCLTAALVHLAWSTHRTETYANNVHPGNALITLSLSADLIDHAVSILARYRPIDVRYSNAEAPGRSSFRNAIRL